MNNLIWSFTPWVGFLLGVRIGGVYVGAGIGLALAAVVLVRAVGRRHVHLFDTIGAAYFGGLLALLVGLHPADAATWGRYAQAVAHGSLTLIVFGSILIGRPFTEVYAREQVSTQMWNSSGFHDFNRKISAIFGLAFLVGTISLVAAGSVDSRQFVLRLVVPFGALLLALLYTKKQASLTSGQLIAH